MEALSRARRAGLFCDPHPTITPQMAFRYLLWILFPLLGCYAVYSLLYLEHKGWYSWVLSMLYGFLLTFGEQAQLYPAWKACPHSSRPIILVGHSLGAGCQAWP